MVPLALHAPSADAVAHQAGEQVAATCPGGPRVARFRAIEHRLRGLEREAASRADQRRRIWGIARLRSGFSTSPRAGVLPVREDPWDPN
jgi:hypothetical protein